MEQRIFGRDRRGFLPELVEKLLWDIYFVDDEAEHELVEPSVHHDETALVAVGSSPGVFNLPLPRRRGRQRGAGRERGNELVV